MKRSLTWAAALVAFLAVGCGALKPMKLSSLQPGLYSATTGLPLFASELISFEQANAALLTPQGHPAFNPAPFPDDKALQFKANRQFCRDTFRLPDISHPVSGIKRIPMPPGAMQFTPAGLCMDEVEITNLDWRLFVSDVFPADSASAAQNAALLPDKAALPVKDYYTSPFYNFYPVVGIGYDQAQLFCEWRSQQVNELFQRSGDKSLVGIVCDYRLPTEAEWEKAAQVRSGQPYGTSCTELPVRVAEGAAAYLQKRSGSATPVAQIKNDIAAYNKQRPVRNWIAYAQPEPYFLRLASPQYVYQGPANDFGLCQMLGNAAEMVAERGITKGGSYRDALAACTIKARGHYTGPVATVGFRTVCTVRRVQ